MGFLSDAGNWLTGGVSQSDYNSLPGVQAPQQSQYQIQGLGAYQNTQNQLNNQLPSAPNLTGATQGTMDQQTQMQQYLQSVAMGKQPTAADQLLQNSQAQGARQLQAGTVSAGGMNPALAMRQLFAQQATQQGNMAGQAAQQKLQEQQQYSQLAGQSSQALYSEQFQNQQQQFANQMGLNQAQSQYAQNIFDSNRAQTSFNTQYQQNQTAYQEYMRSQQYQQMQNNAAARGALVRGVLTAGATVAGGAIGGMLAKKGTTEAADALATSSAEAFA